MDLDVIDSADLFGSNTVNQDEVMAVLTASNNQHHQINSQQQQYVLGGQQACQSGLFYNVTYKTAE